MVVKYINTSTFKPKPNNNSSDIISGNFISGCLGGCWKTYCYASRYKPDNIYVALNQNQIIDSCAVWSKAQPWKKTPNQQDSKYYMVDIGCNSDIPLMQKHLTIAKTVDLFTESESGLLNILTKFDKQERLNTTFATKYSHMLNLDVNSFTKRPRVRISIMPESPMTSLEPNTNPVKQRIKDCERLEALGWEVHWNFSPVVMYKGWKEDYVKLIKSLPPRPCEVIFLTNHKNSMVKTNKDAKLYMKYSNEVKNESGVMRYPLSVKSTAVEWIKHTLEDNQFKVRYIF